MQWAAAIAVPTEELIEATPVLTNKVRQLKRCVSLNRHWGHVTISYVYSNKIL